MLKNRYRNAKIIPITIVLQIIKNSNKNISKMKVERVKNNELKNNNKNKTSPKKKYVIKNNENNKKNDISNKRLKNKKVNPSNKFSKKNNKLKIKKKSKIGKIDNLHISTINKVDELITEMERREKKVKKTPSIFKKIINLGQNNDTIFQTPEFLSTPPFIEYDLSWLNSEEKQELVANFHDGLEDINNNESKMGQTGIFEQEIGNNPKEEFASDFVKPLLSEMINPPDYKTCASKDKKKLSRIKWMFTGISGFDNLLVKGIPKGSNIIVAGGPGSGKTIFCLQTLYNKALEGKDCVFLSMEERPERLMDHLLEFGFKVKEIKREVNQIILKVNGKGRISLKRLQPIKLARSIEALLEKASGTLPIDIDLVLDFFPEDFDVSLLTLDSISAIETAFSGTRRQYRIYIEQLFRYFEHLDITTLMITESTNAPHQFSNTGVEEFLADGIFVFYNFQGVKKRTRGAEVYKLRGAAHSQKIVPMEITSDGIIINSEEVCREQA